MKIFEKIFSVKNTNIHKVVTFCGLKMKFKSKKLIERQRFQQLEEQILQLNNKLENQYQSYNQHFQDLNNKLENNKINNIEKKNDDIYNIIVNSNFIHKIIFSTATITQRMITASIVNKEAFTKYRGINRGKTIVLFGAGPTVNHFKVIDNAIYVGCNRAFLYNKVKFDYMFTIDKAGIQDYYKDFFEYRKNECIKFIGDQNLGENWQIPEHKIPLDIHRYITNAGLENAPEEYPLDISTCMVFNPPTVTLQAMQFILWTQPERIYIVGVDCTAGTHGHFIGETFDTSSRNEDTSANDNWSIYFYKKLKEFAQCYYPDTEIISVNPVRLKGLFKDVYTESYLAEHPEIREELGENIEILNGVLNYEKN